VRVDAATIASLFTGAAAIVGLWVAHRKNQTELSNLRMEARQKEIDKDEAEARAAQAAIDKRFMTYVDGLEGRNKALTLRLEELELLLRTAREETERARTDYLTSKRQLDDAAYRLKSSESNRNRLEKRVGDLEEQLKDC
jgi:chromosome segregation ATPase